MNCTFESLSIYEHFTRGNSPLVWTKSKPFRAYGTFNQNASTLDNHQWHYDNISPDEIVIKVINV